MKKFLQFAGVVALVLVLVGFILNIATHSIVLTDNPTKNWYSAGIALFGSGVLGNAGLNGGQVTHEVSNYQVSGAGLVAWIFALVAIVCLAVVVVFSFLKVKVLEKYSKYIDLCICALLVTAGVVLFFTVPSFVGNNGINNSGNTHLTLGGGWIVAGILYILGGALAGLNSVLSLIKK